MRWRWSPLKVLAPCDLTPGVTSAGEQVNGAWHVYQWTGTDISTGTFQTGCLGSKDHLTLVVSSMPSGDLQYLDATYDDRVVSSKGGGTG